MITRLQVSGFKNLVDVDVRFGPFTCIAGPNAVGKSNLFDAIRFLGMLSCRTLQEAALSVRNASGRHEDVRGLFHHESGRISDRLSFMVEMITPEEAVDDLGQHAEATANFLRYTLVLRYREQPGRLSGTCGGLEIEKEELVHIQTRQVARSLAFDHNVAKWRASALRIRHRAAPFISTSEENGCRVIRLHQDGGSSGRIVSNPVAQPRTVLSVANAAESPTVLCAKREMESWTLMHLEPAALREPDDMRAPFHLGSNGAHLPSTLYHLASSRAQGECAPEQSGENGVYLKVANRLRTLIEDVGSVAVDRDDKRELLTIQLRGRDGTLCPAHSLSDGTLRFLALAVLEMDAGNRGVICLEEPENSIHPSRIPALLALLQDIATNPEEAIGDGNPLSQVIINTHSPSVVLEVPDSTLLVAESRGDTAGERAVRRTVFSGLEGTWRTGSGSGDEPVAKGKGSLLAYLNPVSPQDEYLQAYYARIGREYAGTAVRHRPGHVAEPKEQQPFLPHVEE